MIGRKSESHLDDGGLERTWQRAPISAPFSAFIIESGLKMQSMYIYNWFKLERIPCVYYWEYASVILRLLRVVLNMDGAPYHPGTTGRSCPKHRIRNLLLRCT
jgi:hypothetical protein